MATLQFKAILWAFTALLGFSEALCNLCLLRRKMRFRFPDGLNHLQMRLFGALRGRWLFVSRALRDAVLAFSAGVLLTGPDPVPQLPINMVHSWNIRLSKKDKQRDLSGFRECVFMCTRAADLPQFSPSCSLGVGAAPRRCFHCPSLTLSYSQSHWSWWNLRPWNAPLLMNYGTHTHTQNPHSVTRQWCYSCN